MFNKIEKYIFYFFLFSIPFQARKILWYSSWRFDEWSSISIYVTDILLVILLGFWAARSLYKIRSLSYKIKKSDYFLIAFVIISAVSIKNSDNSIFSLFQWIKLIEFGLFYFYISNYAFTRFGFLNSFLIIFISGIFQAIIAISQFLKQSSLGLKYLGESVINSELSGIASFYLPNGSKIIRAYGTFPHPNLLACFLFLSIFSFYLIYFYSKLDLQNEIFKKKWDRFFEVFYGIILFAFFSTFSRVIGFIWFVSFCIRAIIIRSSRYYRLVFGTKDGRKRIVSILVISFIAILIFSSLFFSEISSRTGIDKNDQAVELRTFYNQQAVKADRGIFGVGIGNFVAWLRQKDPFLIQYEYQPAHNIYLLIYAETGILGIASFFLFLFFLIGGFIYKTKLRKSYHLSSFVFLSSLLFIGFFDHFFWTLQQGRLIFWTSLGLLTYLSRDDII